MKEFTLYKDNKLDVQRLVYILISVGLFFVIWWLAAKYSPRNRIPTPGATFAMLGNIMTTRGTWTNIGMTAYRVLLGAAIGGVSGTAFAIATRYWDIALFAVDNVIGHVLKSVPGICWAFIFVLWFGLSNMTPVLIIAMSVAPIFLVSVSEGIKNMDMQLIEMSSVYTGNKIRILTKVIIPLVVPFIFSAVKSSLSFAWKMIVLSEMYGAFNGIGYMISLAYDGFQVVRILSWTIILLVMMLIVDGLILGRIESGIIRKWQITKKSV